MICLLEAHVNSNDIEASHLLQDVVEFINNYIVGTYLYRLSISHQACI